MAIVYCLMSVASKLMLFLTALLDLSSMTLEPWSLESFSSCISLMLWHAKGNSSNPKSPSAEVEMIFKVFNLVQQGIQRSVDQAIPVFIFLNCLIMQGSILQGFICKNIWFSFHFLSKIQYFLGILQHLLNQGPTFGFHHQSSF